MIEYTILYTLMMRKLHRTRFIHESPSVAYRFSNGLAYSSPWLHASNNGSPRDRRAVWLREVASTAIYGGGHAWKTHTLNICLFSRCNATCGKVTWENVDCSSSSREPASSWANIISRNYMLRVGIYLVYNVYVQAVRRHRVAVWSVDSVNVCVCVSAMRCA